MIEVKKLVQPVSIENPSGESLRYSAVYDRIKAARREDDASAPQGIWQTKLKKADWMEVKSLCLEALESRSKDLQIGAWLLEACIHLDGFAGVVDGLRAVTALCESFWDTLYPPLDPDDPDYRFGPIIWIDEKLTLKLKLIPVTSPGSGDEPEYTWGDWESALHQAKIAHKVGKQVGADKGQPLQAKFATSSSLTPTEFYVDLKQQLSGSLDAADRLEQVLVSFDKKQEGALHHLKDMLRTIQHYVLEVLKQRGPDLSIQPEIELPARQEPEQKMALNEQREHQFGEQREHQFSGPVRNRAHAYQMLAEAADYLMKTEPHSPTPYLVKRAVAWGGLTLGELLGQILRNPGELGELYRLLGLDEMPQKK